MDKLLRELLPHKVRLWLYLILGAIALGIGAWQTAEGDLIVALFSLIGALTNALAAGNVNVAEEV